MNKFTIENQKIAFGTSGLGEHCYKATYAALETGFRLIDTAEYYENEVEVGRAIRHWMCDTKTPRKDVFVQTKLWPSSNNDPAKALNNSLQRLKLDYVDSYLLHWPDPDFHRSIFAIGQLLKMTSHKKFHHLGVSNFEADHLDLVFEQHGFKPWANQVENHPRNCRHDRITYAHNNSISLQGYCALGRGLFEHPIISKIAEQHKTEVTPVILAWAIAKGVVPITRSSKPDHIKVNFQALDINLSQNDITLIDTINDYQNICPEFICW